MHPSTIHLINREHVHVTVILQRQSCQFQELKPELRSDLNLAKELVFGHLGQVGF